MLKEKICKLLGQGLPAIVVANSVGCDPSYISQLLAEQDFAVEVAKLRCAGVEQELSRDSKYNSLEDRMLEKLENILQFIVKPRDVIEALKFLNSAKRRANVIQAPAEGTTTIVNLIMPQTALVRFQLNNHSEVIEVEGRALANMPASNLMKTLEDRRSKDAETSAPQIKLSPRQIERAIITEDSV